MRDTRRLKRKPLALMLVSPATDLSPSSCVMAAASGSSSSSSGSSDSGESEDGAFNDAPQHQAGAGMVRSPSHDYLPLEHVAEGLSEYYVPLAVSGRWF